MLLLGGTAKAADGYGLSRDDETGEPWSIDDYLAAVTGAASTKAAIDYAVTNPYVVGSNTDDVFIKKLAAFGDSYSRLKRKSFPNWIEQLKADGDLSILQGLAVSGATAANVAVGGKVNSFNQQITRWLNSGPQFGSNQITSVYLGYNDINSFGNLAQSKNDYRQGIQTLINNGAVATSRRHIFVFQVHDWGKNPAAGSQKDVFRNRTLEWNRHVADVANGHSRIVAVDLFTAFEKIHADPTTYGLDNVTSVKPAGYSGPDVYLYDDSQHFGLRGQQLINQVFKHYLTRGWDWANTLTVGNATAERLAGDIDEGIVFALAQAEAQPQGLTAFPIGALAELPPVSEEPVDVARAGFAEVYHPDERRDGGVAFNYALSAATRIGIVIGRYDETSDRKHDLSTSTSSVTSDSVAMYLTHEAGGLDLRTRLMVSDDRHAKSEHDALIGSTNRAEFGGRTTEMAQRAGYPLELGGMTWTPWTELTYRMQEVDAFTIKNAYVSDVTYSAVEASETLAGIGLDARSMPISLGEEASLQLFAGLSYTHSLAREDYEVGITEAAGAGPAHREVIERPNVRELALDVGGRMEVGERLAVGMGVSATHDPAVGSNQAAMFRLNYRF